MTDSPAMYFSFIFEVTMNADLEAFHDHGNDVMDKLLKLEEVNEDITDTAISTDAADRTVTIDLVVTNVTSVPDGIAHALTVMQTAVHAAGASTPQWPGVDDVQHATEYHMLEMKSAMDSTLVPA